MIRYFCDLCGRELPHNRNYAVVRPVYAYKNVRVELTSSVNGLWNGGQLCECCLVDVVARGKDINRD